MFLHGIYVYVPFFQIMSMWSGFQMIQVRPSQLEAVHSITVLAGWLTRQPRGYVISADIMIFANELARV
jgi:hypothetical protein